MKTETVYALSLADVEMGSVKGVFKTIEGAKDAAERMANRELSYLNLVRPLEWKPWKHGAAQDCYSHRDESWTQLGFLINAMPLND